MTDLSESTLWTINGEPLRVCAKMPKARGFKAFLPDLSCRPERGPVYFYEVGKDYWEAKAVVCCSGFHFCPCLSSVFQWYHAAFTTRVCIVSAYGEVRVSDDGSKFCTNGIHIDNELTPSEILSFLEEELRTRSGYVTYSSYMGILDSMWGTVEDWRKFKSYVGQGYHPDVREAWIRERYKTFRELLKDRVTEEIKEKWR
jgi:hypothetical protein